MQLASDFASMLFHVLVLVIMLNLVISMLVNTATVIMVR